MNRRDFIRNSVKVGAGIAVGGSPLWSVGKAVGGLTILYTNDWHSRIDPFPLDGGRYEGLGGASKRAALIEKVRKDSSNVILLDAGDIFQGTPYFNYFGGELEFKLMSEMGYDAVTLGNHDFDAGLDGLAKQLVHAKFEILNANYDFSSTILKNKFQPSTIVKKGPWKIGVLGVGIDLQNLVPAEHFGETRYSDPIAAANREADHLKNKLKCDLVICLSHLGYEYRTDKVSDVHLAKNSENIDVILGGHTHTFLREPTILKNKIGKKIRVCQTGWAGINLGKIDYEAHTISTAANPHSTMLKIC